MTARMDRAEANEVVSLVTQSRLVTLYSFLGHNSLRVNFIFQRQHRRNPVPPKAKHEVRAIDS